MYVCKFMYTHMRLRLEKSSACFTRCVGIFTECDWYHMCIMCVCMHACVCVHACMCVCVCVCVYKLVRVCLVSLMEGACVNLCVYLYGGWLCLRACIHSRGSVLCICMCMSVCVRACARV
jgi:hypothetical protein